MATLVAREMDGALRRQGVTIGPSDILIAAVAREHQLPVVTENTRDFSRLPGIEILRYSIHDSPAH
mgnify:CR=1 FL=1